MSDYKLIDYPHCAICKHSDHFIDDSLVCMVNDREEEPVPLEECGSFKLNGLYLANFIVRLTELIKNRETDVFISPKIENLKEKIEKMNKKQVVRRKKK